VQISPDGNTLTIHLENVPVVDAFTFPPPVPNNIAADEVDISPYQLIGARASFDVAYTKTKGTERGIRPATDDPLSPLNWAGKMWDATNSGTFSLTYNDGSFSASGSFDSSGNFGEMGTERNGFFVNHEEEDDADNIEAGSTSVAHSQMSQMAASGSANQPVKVVLLKRRVPVKVSH
jgi:hypothetical protein